MVNGGPLQPEPKHVPASSFDENGRYVGILSETQSGASSKEEERVETGRAVEVTPHDPGVAQELAVGEAAAKVTVLPNHVSSENRQCLQKINSSPLDPFSMEISIIGMFVIFMVMFGNILLILKLF